MIDVLIVSLGSTSGLRAADEELCGSLRRGGASAELVSADPPAPVRTLMLTDLRWAWAARRAAAAQLRRMPARAVIYSSSTAALLWPRAGAIRFDAPSAGNRPGRHGLWQRPLERRRLKQAPLLLPWSAGALEELGDARVQAGQALVVPVAVEPSGAAVPGGATETAGRDIAAITYAANPVKKGLDRVLAVWRRVRRDGEELVVVGADPRELGRLGYDVAGEGVRATGLLPAGEYRALLRRTRVFVTAPRREDYGVAQLEALADGCMLVTTPAPGPYAALPLARALDGRLVNDDLGMALRAALDDPVAGYAVRAQELLAPFHRQAVDQVVAAQLLPRLVDATR